MEIKETYSTGKVGFPISKETSEAGINIAKEMFEKNGYRVEVNDVKDGKMFIVALPEE